jgi:hypothetical protein
MTSCVARRRARDPPALVVCPFLQRTNSLRVLAEPSPPHRPNPTFWRFKQPQHRHYPSSTPPPPSGPSLPTNPHPTLGGPRPVAADADAEQGHAMASSSSVPSLFGDVSIVSLGRACPPCRRRCYDADHPLLAHPLVSPLLPFAAPISDSSHNGRTMPSLALEPEQSRRW